MFPRASQKSALLPPLHSLWLLHSSSLPCYGGRRGGKKPTEREACCCPVQAATVSVVEKKKRNAKLIVALYKQLRCAARKKRNGTRSLSCTVPAATVGGEGKKRTEREALDCYCCKAMASEQQQEDEEDFGYGLFPERRRRGGGGGGGESEGEPSAPQQQPSLLYNSLFTFNHKCRLMLKMALENNPYAKLLLDAMKNSGCTVLRDRHFSCEDCDGCVSGGFDSSTSQIVLCQNNIHYQSHMNRVVTHELIHAFDHCRAHVDWFNNVKHLACSEIRAANLSGDCSLLSEMTRFKFGLKQHHQTCVRDRAVRSILAVRKLSREMAEKAVDEVFESCFNDHEPFGRVPHSKSDAKYAFRDFQNRDRYYRNL